MPAHANAGAASARDVFVRLAEATPGYGGLDFREIGAGGRALPFGEEAVATAQEARA